MQINKEHYRIFELYRLVYKGGEGLGGLPSAAEAEKGVAEKKEVAESGQDEAKDMSGEIKGHREAVTDKIDAMKERMLKSFKLSPHQEYPKAVKKIAQELKNHATRGFDEISEQYNTAREQRGKPFETSKEAKKLEKQARDLHGKIDRRLAKAKDHAEYQARQDRLEGLEGKEDPEAMAEKRRLQTIIIQNVLQNKKTTQNMSGKMRDMIARFIVEGGMIDFDHADLDDYEGNVESFFEFADAYQETVAKQLDKKVLKKVVSRFLEEMPNPEATKDEIDYFTDIIVQNYPAHYGISTEKGSYINKVATALARRYDLHFEGENLAYAVDLTSMKGLSVDEFETSIAKQLDPKRKPASDLAQNRIKTYEAQTSKFKTFKDITSYRKDITESAWYSFDNNIDSWDDWEGHESVAKLMELNAPIKKEVTESKRNMELKTQTERQEAARKALEEGVTSTKLAAGLTQERFAEFEGTMKGPNLDDGEPVKVTLSLTGKKTKDKMTITVDYRAEGDATITISGMEVYEDTGYRKLNHQVTFSVAEFKGVDLEGYVRKLEGNSTKNGKKFSEVFNAVNAINIDGLDLSYTTFDELPKEEIFADDFSLPNATLVMDNQTIGTIYFSEKDNKTLATIHVTGERPQEVGLAELGKSLKTSVKKMKEVAKQAKKNKEDITKKVETDKGEIKTPTGLEVNWAKEIEPSAETRVATINKPDKSEAAGLYMVGEGDKRSYVLQVGTDRHEFDSMKAVNDYLAKNREELVHVPEKPKEVALSTKEHEKLARALNVYSMKLFGMASEYWLFEDKPEKTKAINIFLNNLSPERITELNELVKTVTEPGKDAIVQYDLKNLGQFQLTKKEEGALFDAFKKAYGSMEAVDEEEVRLLSDMDVDINGKKEKFKKVVGENLIKILSMSAEIKAVEGKIMIKEGDAFVPVTAAGLAKHLPESIQLSYKKILNGEEVTDFEKKTETMLKVFEHVKKVEEVMANPKEANEFKKMGLPELIASIGQLYQMFQEAMKTGDFKEMNKFVKDLQEGKNPGGEIKSSTETYRKAVEDIKDTGTLLTLYTQPYGNKAKELFGEGDQATPYRSGLKGIIQKRFESQLGIDITDMEASASGLTMKAAKGPKDYKIYLEESDGKTLVSMGELKMNESGREYSSPIVTRQEVSGLNSGDKNMTHVLFTKPDLDKQEVAKKKT